MAEGADWNRLDRDAELLLSQFGDHLLRRKLTDERHGRFYVLWVRKFLGMAPAIPHATPDESLSLYLDALERDGVEDWQREQARKAVTAWLTWRDTAARESLEPKAERAPDGSVDPGAVLNSVAQTLRVRHYSYRTEQTYQDWIRRFFRYLEETGAMVGDRPVPTAEGFRDFISQLATRQQVGASTQNQAFAALMFLFREVLAIDIAELGRTVRARTGTRLPTVLSVAEVKSLFACLSGTPRLMAELIYGAGLRVSECTRLRVQDIDFDNDALRIRGGKGDKDRVSLLPQNLQAGLRKHLDRVRDLFEQDRKAEVAGVYLPDALARKLPRAGTEWAWFWVFPSRTLSIDPRSNTVRRHHASDAVVQRAVADAARKAGIPKRVTVHSLRHSFATHLLLQNVDIRQVQELLGHAHVETTMIYTHVLKDLRNAPRSPLDRL